MPHKLTITVAEEVYQGLHRRVGRGNISHFIEQLVRPHVVDDDELEAGYRAMAAHAAYEREAREWVEAGPGGGPALRGGAADAAYEREAGEWLEAAGGEEPEWGGEKSTGWPSNRRETGEDRCQLDEQR